MRQPLITTERLRLIPRTRGEPELDKLQLFWLNDPDVVRYSEQRHVKHTLASVRKYVASFDHQRDHLLGIFTKGPDEHPEDHYIGNISVHRDLPNGVAEVGIMIGEKHEWGKGYGKEAWMAACKWVLSNCAIRKVEAGCMQANAPMKAIMGGIGMIAEGHRLGHFLSDGTPTGMLLYGKFR